MPAPSCSSRCPSPPASTIRERVRELSVRVPGLQPASGRPAAGRRGRRRLLSGRRHVGPAALRCRHHDGRANRWSRWSAGAPTRRRSARRSGSSINFLVAQPSRPRSTTTTRTGPAALRELLALFADLSDVVSEQRIRGIEGVSSRPIVRRLRQKNGFNAARGIEITVRFDEKAFEGIGIFLLGAVLDRFFAEYTSINSFTETVIEIQAARRDQTLAAARRHGAAAVTYRERSQRRALGRRFLHGAAGAGALGRSEAAHRRQRGHVRGGRQSRPGSVPRIPGFERVELRGYAEPGIPKLFSRFLGFFGPQGALPLNTTVEAYHWSNGRDPSFARFTDIFGNRFLQLFFRAWANARPIAHHDRPDDDRFVRLCRLLRRHRRRQPAATATASRTSPSCRLPGWSMLEDQERVAAAAAGARHLPCRRRGRGARRHLAGLRAVRQAGCSARTASRSASTPISASRVYSINDKICIADQGARPARSTGKFLPRGRCSDQLTDLVFFYIGHRCEFDVSCRCRRAMRRRRSSAFPASWAGRRGSRRTTMPARTSISTTRASTRWRRRVSRRAAQADAAEQRQSRPGMSVA